MPDREDINEPKAGVASARPHDAPAPSAAPDQDTHLAGLKRRLVRLDPGQAESGPTAVRCELVVGANALRQRVLWWRDLLGTADPCNPALEPDRVLSLLAGHRRIIRPAFLLLWREAASDTSIRARELIALLPLGARTIAGIPAPWSRTRSGGWWPVETPLVHRRYQQTAALAVLGWLNGTPPPAGLLILKDLDADSVFTRTLLSDAKAKLRSRDRDQPFLLCRPGDVPVNPACLPGLTVKVGRELAPADLDAHLALAAAWRGGTGTNSVTAPRTAGAGRPSHLTAARGEGRLALAEASRDNGATASVLALTTGTTASLIAIAANPGLAEALRKTEVARALDGLLAALSASAAVTMVQATPNAPTAHLRRLTARRRLVDVVIPASGVIAAALTFTDHVRTRWQRAVPMRPSHRSQGSSEQPRQPLPDAEAVDRKRRPTPS